MGQGCAFFLRAAIDRGSHASFRVVGEVPHLGARWRARNRLWKLVWESLSEDGFRVGARSNHRSCFSYYEFRHQVSEQGMSRHDVDERELLQNLLAGIVTRSP